MREGPPNIVKEEVASKCKLEGQGGVRRMKKGCGRRRRVTGGVGDWRELQAEANNVAQKQKRAASVQEGVAEHC